MGEAVKAERSLAIPSGHHKNWRGSREVHIRLVALLGAGLLVRLVLLPVGGYRYDLLLLQQWAERLITRPLPRFYASQEVVDHLPGDLWLLWLLGRVTDLVAPGAVVPQIA